MSISTDEPKVNRPATKNALSKNHMNELHDCLSLALDATEGRNISFTSLQEARSYTRRALRILEGVAQ